MYDSGTQHHRLGVRRRLGRRWRHWRYHTPAAEMAIGVVAVTIAVAVVIATAVYLGIV